MFIIKKIKNLSLFSRNYRNLSNKNYHQDLHNQDLNNHQEQQQIKLRSSFNKEIRNLISSNINLSSTNNSLNIYCCGPTVYDHCHIGHAITYIRCDLIIKMLDKYFNYNINYAMNITDIDDKIIKKSLDKNVNFLELSQEYYHSFLNDLNQLNIQKPDYIGKVCDNIDIIMDFIRKLYDKGFAYYSNDSGDINFDYEKFLKCFQINNEQNFGGFSGDSQSTKSHYGKRSAKDFTLWKSSKLNEPSWMLNLSSSNNEIIKGRPGWHIECSAISNSIFSQKVDLHFGGIDLMFPHHHCESCCSHAYFYSDQKNCNRLYSNVNIWLHSGHLYYNREKMSKSLGNVIYIKDFLKNYSTNILRLLCIRTHYRSEIIFDEKILLEMKSLDDKLNEFYQRIQWAIYKLSKNFLPNDSTNLIKLMNLIEIDTIDINDNSLNNLTLNQWINFIEQEIYQGLLNDMDMNRTLTVILSLAKLFPHILPYWFDQSSSTDKQQNLLLNLILLKKLLIKWFDATSLNYHLVDNTTTSSLDNNLTIIEHLSEFRRKIRQSTLIMLKNKNNENNDSELKSILEQCDDTRKFLDQYGFKLKDQKSS